MDKFLSQKLGAPVEIADPLSRIKYDPTIFKLKEILSSFSVAVGLALKAIELGEVRISLLPHVVREKVDHGEILVISEPVPVKLPEGVNLDALGQDRKLLAKVVGEHQDTLKERGDWVVYPLTLQMIAEGRFALDGKGNVYQDGEVVPHGIRLS